MMMLRVTAETRTGFVNEIGRYKNMKEAQKGIEEINDPIISEVPREEVDWLIKMEWIDTEIPY